MGYVMQEQPANNSKGERDFPPIPADKTFRLKVERVQEKVMPFTDDDGNEIKKLSFAFSILDEGEYKNAWVWGDVNLNFVPKSKLTAWAEVLLDSKLRPGFNLDPEVLIGRRCEGVTMERRYGPNKEKSITVVDDIFPPLPAGSTEDAGFVQAPQQPALDPIEEPF